ncbi:MAG TPA: hypothetical protein VGP13_01965 [Candidatus Paceibacterota bacterium]|jgi:hypothetical protein|nr:hypothetical protein [Candidatus Paceibacterota bacterium]
MSFSSGLHTLWRWVKWPILVLLLLFILLFIFVGMPLGKQKYETDQAVAYIHAQKLTHDDVFGSLPPVPDKAESDKTLAGIDANNNGIRDDVEIAIYNNHKDSAKVTAAMYQYAKTEQLFLTHVFNTETWKAAAEEDSRASYCIAETYPRDDLKKFGEVTGARTKEVEDLVFNTPERKTTQDKVDDFATSFGSASGEACDVDVSIQVN